MFFGNILPALSNNVAYFESMSRCCIFNCIFPELKWTVFATLPLHICVAFEACARLMHCCLGGVCKEWFSVCYTYVKFTHLNQNIIKLFYMKMVLHHLSSFLWPTETLPTETRMQRPADLIMLPHHTREAYIFSVFFSLPWWVFVSTVKLSRSYHNDEFPWRKSFMYICFVRLPCWMFIRFWSKESMINYVVCQMDELNNLGSDVPNTDDLNNVLRSFVDDPNSEVRTYSDSLFIPTQNVENMLSQYPNNFSLFSLNIQSLNGKFDYLSAFLSHLNEKGYNSDAICLQETWLPLDGDTSLYNIPGYHLIHQGKICSQHSGLIVYLSNKFSYSVKDIQIRSDLWDGQFVVVYGENLNGKITIGNIYRPPRSNNSNVTLRKFISKIDPVINNIAHENNCSIITGDFNIDLLQINERVEIQKYFDLFVTMPLL